MNLFKSGRKPFLQFLQNLTAQGVILAMALFAARGLDPNSCCDFANTGNTAVFLILLAIFLSAWGASSMEFFEDYLAPQGRHKNMYERLKSPRYKWSHNFHYTWRRNKVLFLEAIFVFGLLQFSLVIVAAQALFMATGFLQAMKG
jgi:hypothetical protein